MILRIITAFVLLGISGVLLRQFPLWVFVFYTELLLLIAVNEWFQLGKRNEIESGAGSAIFVLLTLPTLMAIIGFVTRANLNRINNYETILLMSALVFWLALAPYLLAKKYKVAKSFGGIALGIFLVSTTLIAVADLLMRSVSIFLVGLLLPILADVFAFLGGKLYGRRPFTAISPKKTLEGLITGLVATTLLGGFALGSVVYLPWKLHYLVALLCAIAAVNGDLLESLAKRWAGVKDSGKALPGHGGLLDRFDSHLAALPTLSALLILFLH